MFRVFARDSMSRNKWYGPIGKPVKLSDRRRYNSKDISEDFILNFGLRK